MKNHFLSVDQFTDTMLHYPEADELYRGVLDIDPVNVKAMHNLDVLQQQKWNLLLKLKIY